MENARSPQRTQESWHKHKIACLSLLSGYWYLVTYSSDQAQFVGADLVLTILLLAMVLLAQARLLLLARHRGGVLDLLAGLFAVVNLTALYLSFVLPFIYFDWYLQVAMFAFAWLFAAMFFASFANGMHWRKLLIGAASALFVFQAAVAASYRLQPLFTREQQFSELTAGTDNMTSSPNVRLVEFTQTPNVYFLVFDGMLPEAIASELLDIPSLPYARTLEENGFLRFPNYFSDAARTPSTFAGLFALDPQYPALAEPNRLTAGHKPSPLREIFRANGYQTHLTATTSNFGHLKGDDLDSYEIANWLFHFCFHMVNKPAFALYGYCYFLDALQDRGYFKLEYRDYQTYVDFFLDAVAKKLEKGERHLFVTYFRTPEHAYGPHTSEQVALFSKTYKQGSEKAAVTMEKLLAFLRENDPDAWLFFFSDHGTLMFRANPDDDETVGLRRRVLDGYGGLAAFYPPQACQDHFAPRLWSTTSMLTRDILRCLAGGVDPFVNDVTYRYVEDGIDLTDYLYE